MFNDGSSSCIVCDRVCNTDHGLGRKSGSTAQVEGPMPKWPGRKSGGSPRWAVDRVLANKSVFARNRDF